VQHIASIVRVENGNQNRLQHHTTPKLGIQRSITNFQRDSKAEHRFYQSVAMDMTEKELINMLSLPTFHVAPFMRFPTKIHMHVLVSHTSPSLKVCAPTM
jgi:hypothetical protein